MFSVVDSQQESQSYVAGTRVNFISNQPAAAVYDSIVSLLRISTHLRVGVSATFSVHFEQTQKKQIVMLTYNLSLLVSVAMLSRKGWPLRFVPQNRQRNTGCIVSFFRPG